MCSIYYKHYSYIQIIPRDIFIKIKVTFILLLKFTKERCFKMSEIITPVVTVFNEDEKLDFEGNRQVIDFLIKNGVDGILVLGSAGEFPNLSLKEKLNYFKFYQEYVADRVKLFAGTGCISYEDTLTLSNAVLKMGYNAAVVIEPYYYAMDQSKIFDFYDRLAGEVTGNIMIYNFPARSGISVEPQTVCKLLEKHSNIVGFKDSVEVPSHTNLIFRNIDVSKFSVYSGFDDQFLMNISNHGKGCIGALSNIVPDIWSNLIKASNAQNYLRTMYLTGLIERLMPLYNLDSNPSLLLKKLMAHRGVPIQAADVFPFNKIDSKILRQAEKILDDVLNDFYQSKTEE